MAMNYSASKQIDYQHFGEFPRFPLWKVSILKQNISDSLSGMMNEWKQLYRTTKLYKTTKYCRFHLLCITVNLTVLKRMLERGFYILIRNVSFPPPTDVGSNNPHPWGPASTLAHRLLSDSDIICNGQSSPLVDIVRFGPLRFAVTSWF